MADPPGVVGCCPLVGHRDERSRDWRLGSRGRNPNSRRPRSVPGRLGNGGAHHLVGVRPCEGARCLGHGHGCGDHIVKHDHRGTFKVIGGLHRVLEVSLPGRLPQVALAAGGSGPMEQVSCLETQVQAKPAEKLNETVRSSCVSRDGGDRQRAASGRGDRCTDNPQGQLVELRATAPRAWTESGRSASSGPPFRSRPAT